jgi:hypothetical protein
VLAPARLSPTRAKEFCMIRLAVFTIIGPLIGYFVFIGLAGGLKADSAGVAFGMLVPLAWVSGLVPASITAALDVVFKRLRARSVQRHLLTGMVGYASAYLFMVENYFEIEPLFPFRYDWGLIGAIPAVICSFVTEKLEIPA